MTRMLVALDCDGTMECSPTQKGPVKLMDILRFAEKHRVFIVGNPVLIQWTGFPLAGWVIGRPISGIMYPGSKSKALADWKAAFPDYDEYIVVDDDPSQYPNGWKGWKFMMPEEFITEVLNKEITNGTE